MNKRLAVIFCSIHLLFITDELFAGSQAPPKTSSLELGHLRQTRTASDSLSLKAELARSKAAARIFGGKRVVSFTPRPDFLAARDLELQRILTLRPATDSLRLALELKKQFSRSRPELDEFIALCYWETGNIEKAIKLSNDFLSQRESAVLRQKLFNAELNRGSYDTAKYHLKHSALTGIAHLKSLIHLLYLRSGLYVFLFWAFLLVTLTTLIFRFFLKLFPFEKFHKFVFCRHKIQTTAGIHLNDTAVVSQKSVVDEKLVLTTESPVNKVPIASVSSDSDLKIAKTVPTSHLQRFEELVTSRMLRVIGISSQKESFNRLALSLKLAANFSKAEFQTLIIDANSSKPYIHEIKSCKSSPGLSDSNGQTFEIAAFCQKTNNPNLKILARGSQVMPLTLLQPHQWKSLIQTCQKHFDIIIVNFPGLISLKDNPEFLQPVEMLVIDGPADPGIETYKPLEAETELYFWNRKGREHETTDS